MAETRLRGPSEADRTDLARQLVTILARVQPGMSDKAAMAWAASLLASFAATPADLLEQAVKAAGLRQFQFANEIGPFLAEHVAEPAKARRIKLNRLREMALKARAMPAPCEDRCTPEQAAEIKRSMGLAA